VTREEQLRQLAALKAEALDRLRVQREQEAKDRVLTLAQLLMPEPEAPEDPRRSKYLVARHHKAIAGILEAVEKEQFEYVVIAVHPRSGKTQLVSKTFPAWVVGRDKTKHVVVATYSDDYAQDIGRAVRDIFRDPVYRRVFPGVELKTGSQAADRLEIEDGGQLHFVGRGTGLTGRGGDIMLLDDPFKDRAEADSPTIRERAWTWFTQVFLTRRMRSGRPVIIVATRWHQDDIVGRMTDPHNPHYDPELAKKVHVFHLPAIAGEDDMLGRQPGEALWPERFPLPYLEDLRRLDPRGFSALWQGEPSPEEGEHFKAEWLRTYRRGELPPLQDLHIYGSSDHAVGLKQTNDRTCLLPFGIDRHDDVWILPDVWWQRGDAEAQTKAILDLAEKFHILRWWAEKGHITQSLGPALRMEMKRRRKFLTVELVTPAVDKVQRSRSAQAMMSLGRVHFPVFAPWWERARNELLTFPYGVHDDFVDALSLAGLKIERLMKPKRRQEPKQLPKVGTLGWVKERAMQEQQERVRRLQGGW
jgi:predicted phage terminase large subunit-like protein